MRIPAPEQVCKLLARADDQCVSFIALCAFGGLRLGEAAALKVGDIDFLRREIHVQHPVQRANAKQVEIRPPKYASERTVYAPAGLMDTLSERIRDLRLRVTMTAGCFPVRASIVAECRRPYAQSRDRFVQSGEWKCVHCAYDGGKKIGC
jgi:integrase